MTQLKKPTHSRKAIEIEVVEKIKRELKAGYTKQSVADENGVSLTTVKNIKRKMMRERSTKELEDFIKYETMNF